MSIRYPAYEHEPSKMLLQIQQAEELSMGLLRHPPASAPARAEVDCTLTAEEIELVGEWAASYRGNKIAETCELWDKFRRGYETVIRDVQK